MRATNCFADPKPGSISSLRCQKSRTRIRQDATCEVMFRGRLFRGRVGPSSPKRLRRARFALRLRGCATRSPKGEAWWSQTGSNRRPHACKARALPAELWPRTRRRMPCCARLRWRYGAAAFVQEACRAEAAGSSEGWWAWEDLNFRPHAYQARALTN